MLKVQCVGVISSFGSFRKLPKDRRWGIFGLKNKYYLDKSPCLVFYLIESRPAGGGAIIKRVFK
jgi:hypothetical protein